MIYVQDAMKLSKKVNKPSFLYEEDKRMKQLIKVIIAEENIIELWQWSGKWQIVDTINNVCIGKKGAVNNKKEGDMKTPLGLFKLGVAFGINNLNIDYPYIKITDNSYWVDDVDSKFYNKWVEINGNIPDNYSYIVNSDKKEWKSAEHLIDYPKNYELGIVIEYNTEKFIKNNGSAIFMHIKNKDYTYGCIAAEKQDIIKILNFLDEKQNPHILIQTK